MDYVIINEFLCVNNVILSGTGIWMMNSSICVLISIYNLKLFITMQTTHHNTSCGPWSIPYMENPTPQSRSNVVMGDVHNL